MSYISKVSENQRNFHFGGRLWEVGLVECGQIGLETPSRPQMKPSDEEPFRRRRNAPQQCLFAADGLSGMSRVACQGFYARLRCLRPFWDLISVENVQNTLPKSLRRVV